MYALQSNASDIHFLLEGQELSIQFRTSLVLKKIHQDIWSASFFEYLKFIAGFDLTNLSLPQSGQFAWNQIFCRFIVIYNQSIQTGVLRSLSTKKDLKIEELTYDPTAISFLKRLCHSRQGLVLMAGPINSGITTTIHAVLHEMASISRFKIVSLEDPIEIEDNSYLQLQINQE